MNNLQIFISDEAVRWYKEELELTGPTNVRFHVRYGGVGGNVPGFSLGLAIEAPSQIHTSVEADFITFYIEESDAWYFENKNLVIKLDEGLNEPQFTYEDVHPRS